MPHVIKRQWIVVFISILLFVGFLIPLSFRRKANWTEYGLVTAFFVSLFIEMYGIPLTIMFASKYFGRANISLPHNQIEFRILGYGFGMDLPMVYGAVLIVLGTLLVVIGWITLYINVKKRGLVTTGIYSFSRHPQYLGFIMLIAGWLVGWPSILTLLFVPVLIFMYVRVCLLEEMEMAEVPGYAEYHARVPFFI